MRVMIKVSTVIVLFIMVLSCATAPGILPEKYSLDNELEAVDQITTFREPKWQKVDNQSVILEIDWKDYYLIVLRRPMEARLPITIGISSTLSTITAGQDRVVVIENGISQFYYIEKIYRLKGAEQAEEIKKRFSVNKEEK